MTEQEMLDLLDLVMKQQNLLNLLKEKKVDIEWISDYMYNNYYSFEILMQNIDSMTYEYNDEHKSKYKLTKEEMTIIINWLKEE